MKRKFTPRKRDTLALKLQRCRQTLVNVQSVAKGLGPFLIDAADLLYPQDGSTPRAVNYVTASLKLPEHEEEEVEFTLRRAGGKSPLSHLTALAEELMEPLELPVECPPLGDRLLMAVQELLRERHALRNSEHDLGMQLVSLEKALKFTRGFLESLASLTPQVQDVIDEALAGVSCKALEDRLVSLQTENKRLHALLQNRTPKACPSCGFNGDPHAPSCSSCGHTGGVGNSTEEGVWICPDCLWDTGGLTHHCIAKGDR